MTAPNPSNSLVFCQDLKSENGTFIDSRRIPKGEALLLQHGDCLEIRHAAKIHLIQDNTTLSSVDKAIGVHDDLNALLQTFYIDRRVVGQGGHAKVELSCFTVDH
jgi:pSer/pThr/pTyr-binding forkhead associated (FHA) protein